MVVLLVSACAQQKSTASAKNKGNTTKAGNNITQIVMDRTACYGTCPVYSLEINSDGSVKYTGRSFVDYEGVYTTTISTKKIEEIFTAFENHDVDTCSNEYNSMMQDVPGIFYNIRYGKKKQNITNAHFGPQFLIDLANKIDSVIKVDDSWTKVETEENNN